MVILLKKNLSLLLLISLLAILFFLLRLPNLTLQPIFADEAIYIRWAQVMRSEPTLRFLPMSDGKPPLFMWAMIPLFKFINDPLLAGRFLSVVSGFAAVSGIFFLGWRFFNIKTALWASFLMVITPMMIFFDRMALVDSMLSAFSVWALFVGLLLVRHQRIDLAMLLGYLLGGGMLTKPPAFFNIISLPATLLIFQWKEKMRQNKLLKLFGLWMITLLITFAIYNILRLGPGFNLASSRNQDYVFSPLELVGRPLDPFIPHLHDVQNIFLKLITIPISIPVLLGVVLTLVRKNKVCLVILAWSLIPLLIEMAFLKTFTARYILPSIPPLIFLGGWAVVQILERFNISKWYSVLLTALLLLAFPLQFVNKMMSNSLVTYLPNSERGYFRDWTAGYGLKELAGELTKASKDTPIVVGTEGGFGTLPDGLQIYLDKNRQVAIIGGGPNLSQDLLNSAREHPTYFVANRRLNYPTPANYQLVSTYLKSTPDHISEEGIILYYVLPEEEGVKK